VRVTAPWLPLPKELKQGYRFWQPDHRLPAVGQPLIVQCEEGTRYVHATHTTHLTTGKPAIQFVSDDTGFPLKNVWCFVILHEELHQPSKAYAVSFS
jgi:hypothetical protein